MSSPLAGRGAGSRGLWQSRHSWGTALLPDSAPAPAPLSPTPNPRASWAGAGQGAWGSRALRGDLWLCRVSGCSGDSGMWSPG